MSKAHYFHSNFNYHEVINLLCYDTRFPETLTNVQKVTRLYRQTFFIRAVIRRSYSMHFQDPHNNFCLFHQYMIKCRRDFKNMYEIRSKEQLETHLKKYEKYIDQNFDVTMIINQCRPYSQGFAKYYVFNDNQLKHDFFGYYSGERQIAEGTFQYGMMAYPDYPMTDFTWCKEDEITTKYFEEQGKSFSKL